MGEIWDIYDVDKQLTGRTMKRNDWNMKDGDCLGILIRSACTVACCIYTINVSLLSSVNNNMSTSHIKS